MNVFLLWHTHEFPSGEEDIKLIGVYSSHELADQARQRAVTLAGFRDAPTGFCIDRFAVDQDNWTDGYVTETHENVLRRWHLENANPARQVPAKAKPTGT